MHHGLSLTDGLFKVLAVDLLNPSPAAEARKHKLKVCCSSLEDDTPSLFWYSDTC